MIVAIGVFLSGAAWGAEEAGRLVITNGKVSIASAARGERGARPNETLFRDDTVTTSGGSSAKILFTDQSIMDLGPDSALKIEEYALKDVENRTGVFSLLYGKLRALVTKSVGPAGTVSINTKDSVMGVRGTEFVVDKPRNGATSMVVVSGLVRVQGIAGGPPLFVAAGQKLMPQARSSAAAAAAPGGRAVAGSAAPTVSKASAEELHATTSQAKAADNTFSSAVTISGGSSDESRAIASVASAADSGASGSTGSSESALAGGGKSIPTILPPVVLQPGSGTVHLRLGIQ